MLRRVCCKLVVVTQKEIQSFKLKHARFEPPAARRLLFCHGTKLWLLVKVDRLRGVC